MEGDLVFGIILHKQSISSILTHKSSGDMMIATIITIVKAKG